MRTPDKQKDRLQIPLMYAFRDAFRKHDSQKAEDIRVDGERVVSDRGSIRRRGTDEKLLQRDLFIDLNALCDTVNLGSAVDLSGFEYVKRSVLNYGLDDLVHITLGSEATKDIVENLKAALLQHEPRLSRETLAVEPQDEVDDEVNQKVRFRVSADLICKPLDIPIEFVAEVESTSGKVILPRMPR